MDFQRFVSFYYGRLRNSEGDGSIVSEFLAEY